MGPSQVEQIFHRYGPMVLRRARTLLGNDEEAKDLMQEVFIKAMAEPAPLEDPRETAAWLYRVTTNAALNQLRNTRRRGELRRERLGTSEPQPSHQAESRLVARRLLADADASWAQAAVLVHVDGMSYEEASQVLGVSKRTISNFLTRFRTFALERLQEAD